MTVHYPFHPLHQQSLEVVAWPRPGRLAVTVRQPDGRTLKIPLWMIEPAAAKISLGDQVELTASVLDGLVALLNAHACTSPRSTSLRTLVKIIFTFGCPSAAAAALLSLEIVPLLLTIAPCCKHRGAPWVLTR